MGVITILVLLPIFFLLILSGQYIVAGGLGVALLGFIGWRIVRVHRQKTDDPLERYAEEVIERTSLDREAIETDIYREFLDELERFKDIPEMDNTTLHYLQLFYFQKLQKSGKNVAEAETEGVNSDEENAKECHQQQHNILARIELLLFIGFLFVGGVMQYISADWRITVAIWSVGLASILWGRDILQYKYVYYAVFSLFILVFAIDIYTAGNAIFSSDSISRWFTIVNLIGISTIYIVAMRIDMPIGVKKISAVLVSGSIGAMIILSVVMIPYMTIPTSAIVATLGMALLVWLVGLRPNILESGLYEYVTKGASIMSIGLPAISILYMIFWFDFGFLPIFISTTLTFASLFWLYIVWSVPADMDSNNL